MSTPTLRSKQGQTEQEKDAYTCATRVVILSITCGWMGAKVTVNMDPPPLVKTNECGCDNHSDSNSDRDG